jgi:hypothetical protein
MPAPMTSTPDQTTPIDTKASPPSAQADGKWGRRVGGIVFLGMAIALHSLAFVVPWPDSEVIEEPEPEVVLEPEPPAIEISRLPATAPDPDEQGR